MIEKIKHRAVLAIWTDFASDDPEAIMRWYRQEHLDERTSVPGFVTGNKYAEERLATSSGETAPHFAFYETLTIRELSGGLYHQRLSSPTAMTRQIMPGFRRAMRTAMHVAADVGQGRGAFAGTIRFRPESGRTARLETWLHQDLLPAALTTEGIIRAQFWQGDAIASFVDSEERRMRTGDDLLADWALIFEATASAPIQTLFTTLASGGALAEQGADATNIAINHYRFQFGLTNPVSYRL